MIQMKTYMMTLKRMMMMALLLMVTVSAMADEQKIWLHISGNGKVKVFDGETTLLDAAGEAKLTDAGGKTITVSVTPDTGYAVETVTAQRTTSADNAETRNADDASFLTVKKESDTKYTFEMPKDFNVRINVSFISTKKDPDPVYYLFQSFGNTGFYMRPDGTGKVSTLNILTDDMKWYFLDSDESGYYYICDKEGNYLYFSKPSGSTSDRTWMQLKNSLDDNDKAHYKFSRAKNNTKGWDAYNIIPYGNTGLYCLNKQGRNAGANGIQVSNGWDDENSNWVLIPLTTYEWTLRTDCFRPSNTSNKYFYQIKCRNNGSYYIKPGATYVETSNTVDDDMIWYFEEAESDELMTYYYIRLANTGQYMRYRSTAVAQDNAIELSNHDGSETGEAEDRFQFIVVRGAVDNEPWNTTSIYFNIVPKLLKSTSSDNSIKSVSNDKGLGKPLRTKSSRNGADNQWSFVSVEYSTVCANPTITFSSSTGKATIATTTTRSTIYYTIDGTEPSSSNGTAYTAPFDVTEQTTIKAIVTRTGFTDSEVTTETFYKVASPTIQNNEYSISITTETEGATIYYTTNDSDPTTSSTEYTSPLTVGVSGTTIKAIAVKDGMINSVVASKVGTETTLRCATPTFTKSGSDLTINCDFPSSGVNIYYIKNGGDSEPTTLYSGSITVTDGDVVKAIAKADGYNDSKVGVKIMRAPLSPTDGKYLITNDTEFESFVDMANSAENDGFHYVLKAHVETSVYVSRPFTGTFEAAMDANGNFCTISGLTHPLFNTINGGTVKNVMLKDVKISGSDNIGAIAGVAEGYSRIYNCGILPSDKKYENETSYVSSSDGYCGGLIGWLKDDSRVINCFSYANITGGTDVAGIVGHNDFASTTEVVESKYASLKTAVVNCMFYGNIIGGSNRYPVYGGAKMTNTGATAINNYDFYRAEANLGLTDNDHYNCSWPAQEDYLTKYEYYRYLLNSNRELCGWWVGAPSAPSGMSTTDVQAVAKDASLMAKWVLDPSIAPYPILKPAGKYYSVINQDPDNRINPVSKAWESRPTSSNTITTKAVPDTEGQKLGSIIVTINKGGTLSGSSSKSITITAMDIENNDFCYGKIQLPYYNSIFGNPNSSDWTTRYGGNYGDQVVVGWEITSVTGGTEGTLVKDWQNGYNFADRDCTNKDKERIFAQGGYYYVPNGVTAITITAKWADATYLDNNDNYYDRISVSSVSSGTANATLSPFAPAGTRSTTLGNGKTVKTGAILSNLLTGSVYEKAIVLVGNNQNFTGNNDYGNKNNGFTVMSADFDLDDEPDYSLIWQLGNQTSRYDICPIRFDFLPVIEMGMAMKEDGSTQYYSLGCYRPLGHFEVTETSLIHFGQFEFANQNRSLEAPLILNGGIYDQFTKGTGVGNAGNDDINYMIIGGNAYIPSFTPGAHVNNNANYSTRHCAVNVLGGRINNLYLTGNFNNNVTPNVDNPHCYIDGGNFKQVAAAGKEGINGNVFFKINHSVIEEFYGGSTLADKLVTGNINVTVDNSKISKYCGGPKFGNMASGKTVTTNATGTTFGVYYGGGNGGTSYVQYDNTDVTEANAQNPYDWNGGSKGKLNSYNPTSYRSDGKNYMADYEMEIVNSSAGTDANKAIFRTYFYAAQFSATNTGPVSNYLTDCKVLTNFYGGGNLGGVKGDVSSILTDTEIQGSAFGAGYSASVPEVTIYNKNKTAPTINVYTGIITPTPDPDPSSTSSTYTWTNDQSLSTSSPKSSDGKYFFTEEPLGSLGTITGNIYLTIKGNTTIVGKVFNKDGTQDATKTGGVYGGGDESAVNGSTQVNLQGNATVNGNVFGGGNNGVVSGSTTVNIEN